MNKYLHGNGHWCQTCNGTGRGEISDVYSGPAGTVTFYRPCEECKGERRIPVHEQEERQDAP